MVEKEKFLTIIKKNSPLIKSTEVDELFSRTKNVVIVNYNPWKNFDNKKIIQDFFETLSSSLNQYDTTLAKKVKKYGKYLNNIDSTTFTKILDSTIDTIQTEKTLTELFVDINQSIERTQKRILIFVDDLDRLTGDELIDILKLIRNTANFRNTFFIVAYDHNYVLNTIEKKNLISNKEEYLQKIVQLEISLPIFSKNIIHRFLEEQLKEFDEIPGLYNKIRLSLNEIVEIHTYNPSYNVEEKDSLDMLDLFSYPEKLENNLLFNTFQNLRDAVRFINSFKISLESIGSFGDVYEIMLLEILKTRYLSVYQLLSNKMFLSIKDDYFKFNNSELKKILDNEGLSINIKQNNYFIIEAILNNIFNTKRKMHFRSVKVPRYFSIYFTYQTPGLMQLEQIETALKNNDIVEIETIIKNEPVESLNDLTNFFISQKVFSSTTEFEVFFKSILVLSKYNKPDYERLEFKAQETLRDETIPITVYNNETSLYKKFLLSIFKDGFYNLSIRGKLAGDELYKVVNGNKTIFGNHKSELQEILLAILKNKINEISEFNLELFDYYLKNLDEIQEGTRKIIITEQANKAMKELILKNKFSYFKNYFLREYPLYSFRERNFQFDPFATAYFNNDWQEIKDALGSPEVVKGFQNEADGIKFHTLLKKIVNNPDYITANFFLLKDEEEIKLTEKFILLTNIKRKANSSTKNPGKK